MMMQLRIGSLLLLALGIHGAIVKRDAGPDLSGINSFRRQIGGIARVEMPALEWDEGLVKKAKKMPNDCLKQHNGPDYRVFPDKPDENAAKMLELYYTFMLIARNSHKAPKVAREVWIGAHQFDSDTWRSCNNAHPKENALNVELLNPNQNKIGCAPIKCTMTVPRHFMELGKQPGMPKELHLISDNVTFSSVCVLGPSKGWTYVNKIMTAFTTADGANGGKISYDMASSVMASTVSISIFLTSLFYCDKGCDKEKDKKDAEDQMEPEEEKLPEVKFTKFGLCFIGPYNNPSMAHFKTGKSLDCGDLPTDKGLCDAGAERGEHKAQALTDDKESDKKAKEVRNGAEEAYPWLISLMIFLIM